MDLQIDKNNETLGILLKDISFSYGENPVIQALSLSIPKGEIWALIGRSGVGKTTLLQIVAGLFHPDGGCITVQGRDNIKAGRIKGVVFQDQCLLGWLTVEKNLMFPNHKNATQINQTRARQILSEVGLAGLENKMPNSLSAGMWKRVEFARALMIDNEYLLADEPFGTVDALTRRDLWDLWQRIRKAEPRTGILSTHDPEEAIRLCDVIVPLISGPPARFGNFIEVPKGIRLLSSEETNQELLELKLEVMKVLK